MGALRPGLTDQTIEEATVHFPVDPGLGGRGRNGGSCNRSRGRGGNRHGPNRPNGADLSGGILDPAVCVLGHLDLLGHHLPNLILRIPPVNPVTDRLQVAGAAAVCAAPVPRKPANRELQIPVLGHSILQFHTHTGLYVHSYRSVSTYMCGDVGVLGREIGGIKGGVPE